MQAMILKRVAPIEKKPLELEDIPIPQPGVGQIRVKISACGVCHTELDEIEGRLASQIPVIPGHQIVGTVEALGKGAKQFRLGERVGIAWINNACGKCDFCRQGNENLCLEFQATGCDANGGYAEYTVIGEDFAYPIPDRLSDCHAAPLLCAGAIGFRALRLTGIRDGQVLGLFGFGSSAHIVIQIVKYEFPNCRVFVFTRTGHDGLAEKLGADWIGATGDTPPNKLHCAIDFTPAWKPIVEAMKVLERGGRLVINAIRKENEDLESFLSLDYPTYLWLEKELKTVANITRNDVRDFLPLAADIPIVPKVQQFGLAQANEALILLKQGKIHGAGVLKL